MSTLSSGEIILQDVHKHKEEDNHIKEASELI